MPKLAPIQHPIGAVAACRQMFCSRPTPEPRGIEFSPGVVKHRTVMLPSDSTALTLKPMLDGYLTGRTVMFSHAVGDALRMFNSETLEIQHAFDGVLPKDGSLPPRHVACTLLYYGKCGTTMPKTYLDALAHLASTPIGLCNNTLGAAILRLSVLADYEADWYASQVRRESCSTFADIRDGVVQFCVRWVTKDGIRSEFADLPGGVGLDRGLAIMKNFMIAMKVQYRAPISDNVCVSHGSVSEDAWVTSLYNATTAFSRLMEGVPHVAKCKFLQQYPEVDIDTTRIYVRISERARGENGVHDSSAFHGFLVGNSAFMREIVEHCATYKELPPPDDDTAKYCLHTCAVQTQVMPLGTRVSTYAQGGACAQPFSTMGNWLYRLDPAIVPLEDVLRNFVVTPCTMEAAMPGDKRLEKPMHMCINRAYRLFCVTFGGTKKREMSGAEWEARPLCAITPSSHHESKEAIYARTAFGVDIPNASRVLVGDAYNVLASQNAPPQLTNLLLQSAMRFGVNTPILNSLEMAATSLVAFTSKAQQEADRNERDRNKRVAEGGLVVRTKRVRVEGSSIEGSRIVKKHVNSLLGIAGISKTKGKAEIPSGNLPAVEFGGAVTMLCEALIPTGATSASVVAAAAATAKSARCYGAMNAIAAATAVCKASKDALKSIVFLVHHLNTDEKVTIYKVMDDGAIFASSPGLLLECKDRRVFIVRETVGKPTAELVGCEF